MVQLPAEIRPVREGLLKVGFHEDRLLSDVPVPDSTIAVSLLAFSDQPFDSRTASISALYEPFDDKAAVAAIRPLGAPLAITCRRDRYGLWSQRTTGPQFHAELTAWELGAFFEQHRQELSPSAIYRAKTWGRLEQHLQTEFVDIGLMPLIEREAGQKLTDLLERVVAETKTHLGWNDVSVTDGRWLLQSTFWLLAAKILHDKDVPNFVRLELTDIEDVYSKVAKHYNTDSPRPLQIGSQKKRDALIGAAEHIKAFAHCGTVSTEALGFLYESALIEETVRQKLGTHSTPIWLVDYIIGKLRPWIADNIAVADRSVFEPACGHAAFLISAMRLLSELRPANWNQPRRTYLRERLHGIEIDSFALEIARLSLTLADVPNPNGWNLTEENMFKADLLARGVRDATIVVGNPPFENFGSDERRKDFLPNKAAETFRQIVEHLTPGSIFGLVLPQTLLHAKQAGDVRKLLLKDYEIAEIDLFADKVFQYGEPESVVILGRRLIKKRKAGMAIRFQRIREGQIQPFSRSYEPSSTTDVNPEVFGRSESCPLLIPDLNDVWEALKSHRKFHEFADIGQGLIHKSQSDPTLPRGTITESATPKKGLHAGFSNWTEAQMTHELPQTVWLNLQRECIRRPVRGTTVGAAQVLWNYARVSREPWRLKALIDKKGHPVTSRFNVVRPKIAKMSLFVLWALCNSPIANAYAYCISNKRDVLAGAMREMPVPDFDQYDLGALENLVANYFELAKLSRIPSLIIPRPKTDQNSAQMSLEMGSVCDEGKAQKIRQELKIVLWRIDTEVLRLYNLPEALERKILDLFSGVRRRGVPFEQTEYFPKGFTDLHRLRDLLAITSDWEKTNRRRAKLMDSEERGTLTSDEFVELNHLQLLADASVSLFKSEATNFIMKGSIKTGR